MVERDRQALNDQIALLQQTVYRANIAVDTITDCLAQIAGSLVPFEDVISELIAQERGEQITTQGAAATASPDEERLLLHGILHRFGAATRELLGAEMTIRNLILAHLERVKMLNSYREQTTVPPGA